MHCGLVVRVVSCTWTGESNGLWLQAGDDIAHQYESGIKIEGCIVRLLYSEDESMNNSACGDWVTEERVFGH